MKLLKSLPPLAPRKFERLMLLGPCWRDTKSIRWVSARCECGSVVIVRLDQLKTRNTKSCGCLKRQGNRLTHGESVGRRHTPEYQAWLGMKQRCTNPQNISFRYYGQLGVKVCARWANSFEHFLEDMGRRPSAKHSIDRFPNKSGNYQPGNCRWATPTQQSRNRRRTRGWSLARKLPSQNLL